MAILLDQDDELIDDEELEADEIIQAYYEKYGFAEERRCGMRC